MNKENLMLLVFMILILMGATAIWAQAPAVPQLINYQGKLTGADGQPLPTADYRLDVSIYADTTGVTPIWGPQCFDGLTSTGHGAKVPVVQGFFNVILGDLDTNGKSIVTALGSSERYLGIKVNGGQEIRPRQRILSAPFALKAENGVPVGTVVAFWANTAPDGWLICNGDPVPDGARYDALRSLVGSKVPDLRGMFLRGIDAGRTIGSFQADSFSAHNHGMAGAHKHTWKGEIDADVGRGVYHLQLYDYRLDHSQRDTTEEGGAHQHNMEGGLENRPKNIGVKYIIKY